MKVFKRMVSTATSTSPLEDDWERWVCFSNVNDLLNGVRGAWLEGDMLETKGVNVFLSDLDGGDTSTDG